MTLLALCGGLLGVLFMVPLRRYLIAASTASCRIPRARPAPESWWRARSAALAPRYVFLGLAPGPLFKAVVGWLKVLPDHVQFSIPFLRKGQLGMEMSAALFGVGYILGPASRLDHGRRRPALVAGDHPGHRLVGSGRVEPLYPETVLPISEMSPSLIWTRYVRYIGAGAVATGGLITLIRSIPTMVESFRSAPVRSRALGRRGAGGPRTDRDLPLKAVIGAGILFLVLTLRARHLLDLPSVGARALAAVWSSSRPSSSSPSRRASSAWSA